jgi:hypothetical protein
VEEKEEEKIINMRINSDDLFLVFGLLSMIINGIKPPREMTKEVIFETVQRITNLNLKNKEFLDAVEK